MPTNEAKDFNSLKQRLDEIVDLVSDEELSIDEALKLYEEAVGIGLTASSLLEEDIAAKNAQFDSQSENDASTAAAQESTEA